MGVRYSLAALVGVALLGLSACSGGGVGEDETSISESPLTSTISSTSTSSTSSSSSERSSPESSTVESSTVQLRDEPVGEPQFVECTVAGGSWTTYARFTDGSSQWHPDCQALRDEQLAQNPYKCPGTDARVPDSSYCTPEVLGGGRPSEAAPTTTRYLLEGDVFDESGVYEDYGDHTLHFQCVAYNISSDQCREIIEKYGPELHR